MKLEIITAEKKNLWNDKLNLLEEFSGLKVYKEIEYLNLYTNNQSDLECIFIEEEKNFFFYSLYKKKNKFPRL